MGDRGNIFIQEATENGKRVGVFLYGHWAGDGLPDFLQRALRKKWSWNDDAYLARIVFDEMTKGHSGTETGFGISVHLCDNEHPILVVNVPEKKVEMIERPGNHDEPLAGKVLGEWPFGQFIELPIEKDGWAALGRER